MLRRVMVTAALAAAGLLPALSSAHTSAAAVSPGQPLRLRVLAWAKARTSGLPYSWGGNGPGGYDCSGLVQAAYDAAGDPIPRTTNEMLASPKLIPVPRSQARLGDLAFYGDSHVELVDSGPAWGVQRTFGALAPGTLIGVHFPSSWWRPSAYYKVRGAG